MMCLFSVAKKSYLPSWLLWAWLLPLYRLWNKLLQTRCSCRGLISWLVKFLLSIRTPPGPFLSLLSTSSNGRQRNDCDVIRQECQRRWLQRQHLAAVTQTSAHWPMPKVEFLHKTLFVRPASGLQANGLQRYTHVSIGNGPGRNYLGWSSRMRSLHHRKLIHLKIQKIWLCPCPPNGRNIHRYILAQLDQKKPAV